MSDDFDELLSADEIEALLKEAGGGDSDKLAEGNDPEVEVSTISDPASTGAESASPGEGTTGNANDVLDDNDIEALLQQHSGSISESEDDVPREQPQAQDIASPAPSRPSPDEILQKAERDLQAAINPEPPSANLLSSDQVEPKPFEFAEFLAENSSDHNLRELASLQEVDLDLRIELGRAELLIEEVMRLKEGSVVPLDKLAGDPVDILVNNRLMARGEVLVLNDNFCVRVTEILTPDF